MKTKPLYSLGGEDPPSGASIGEEIRRELEKRGLRASIQRTFGDKQEQLNGNSHSEEHQEDIVSSPKQEDENREGESRMAQSDITKEVAPKAAPMGKDEAPTEPLADSSDKETVILDPISLLKDRGDDTRISTVSELLSMISHELRTPLQTITGFLELLLGGKVPDAQQVHHFLSIAHRDSQYLANRITDLEAASVIQAGRFNINPIPLSIDRVVSSCIQHFVLKTGERRIHVEENSFHGLPTFHADEVRLQHVLNNVLEVALRNAPSDGQVNICANMESENLHILVIYPQKKQSKVSKKVDNIDGSRQSTIDLGGMGIFMARYLVEAHGGHLILQEGEDQTLVYDIELPLIPAGKARGVILVTEDNPHAGLLLEYALEKEGFRPILAMDGMKALEQVAKEPIDLVLLDVVLPGMDGFEVCRRIRTSGNTASIPIIMISAKASEEDRAQALRVGADAYFQKPLGLSELISVIDDLLGKGHTPLIEGSKADST
jgi:CheY-like chemotaxis protein